MAATAIPRFCAQTESYLLRKGSNDTVASKFEIHDTVPHTSAQCTLGTAGACAPMTRTRSTTAASEAASRSWIVGMKKSLGGRIETDLAVRSLTRFPLAAGSRPANAGRYRAGSPLRHAQRHSLLLLLLSNAGHLGSQCNGSRSYAPSCILSRGIR